MVVITVPFAKAPKEEIGAVEFASMLSTELQKKDTDVKMLFGKDHADITNVETAQGRDTSYVRAYYEELELHDLHIDIRSFEADHELHKDNDIMLGFFPYTSNQSLYEGIENILDEYGVVSVVEVAYATHRLSLVSEVLFDTQSVILYLNEGAVDLFSSVAEVLAEFVSQYEAHKSPLADAQASI
jgi:hypothetical protein